jgi:hypothetical protein
MVWPCLRAPLPPQQRRGSITLRWPTSPLLSGIEPVAMTFECRRRRELQMTSPATLDNIAATLIRLAAFAHEHGNSPYADTLMSRVRDLVALADKIRVEADTPRQAANS